MKVQYKLYVLISYIIAMVLGLESLIWGRFSFLSDVASIISLNFLMLSCYRHGYNCRDTIRFLRTLGVMTGGGILVIAIAYLNVNATICQVVSIIFLWPIGIPFLHLNEVILADSQMVRVILLSIPYIMIFVCGVTGVKKER